MKAYYQLLHIDSPPELHREIKRHWYIYAVLQISSYDNTQTTLHLSGDPSSLTENTLLQTCTPRFSIQNIDCSDHFRSIRRIKLTRMRTAGAADSG